MRTHLILIFLFCSVHALSQKVFNVLDWKTDVTLNTYLVQRMQEQYDGRRKALAKALASRKGIEAYQLAVHKRFKDLLGEFPAKGALNPKITGHIQREGYKIEKVVYESFPDHHITANLYLPQGKGPFPAALLFCGHEDVSKATESYQSTAILLAKNGFVVLAVDPISQSERHQLLDPNGRSMTRGGTTEHTLLNETSNLVGTSAPAYELWDNIRSLDYLVTRKEVDTTRIGCLGNSGGAMQAIYFSAFDHRVKLIVLCSYLANRERTLELSGPADGCAQIPGEGKAGLELSDYLIASAPKPILVLAGRYDFIDYRGTEIAFDELKQVYTALGQPQKVQLFTYDDGHGISQPKREAAVTWLRRWFYNDPSTVKEGILSVLTDKDLFATRSGQVGTEYAEEVSLAKRNRNLYDSLANSRREFLSRRKSQVLDTIRTLLAISPNKCPVQAEAVGSVKKDSIPYEKLILRKKGEVPLPILIAYPSIPKKIILWLNDKGKDKLADSAALIQSYRQKGYAVILADLRGMGETKDKEELNDAKYFNREYRNVMLALHIGQSIVGQRVTDIYTLLEYIETNNRLAGLPVELHASGWAAVPALHNAVLSGKINSLHLYNSIGSYKEILENPTGKNCYSYIVPNVLKYYDLPDLVQILETNQVKFHQDKL
jgi:dienelactone hydrolase